jgi:hypothetical protein
VCVGHPDDVLILITGKSGCEYYDERSRRPEPRLALSASLYGVAKVTNYELPPGKNTPSWLHNVARPTLTDDDVEVQKIIDEEFS